MKFTIDVDRATIEEEIQEMNKEGYTYQGKSLTYNDVVASGDFEDYLEEYINNGGISAISLGIRDAIIHSFRDDTDFKEPQQAKQV